jgi:hypothetical protein
MGSRRGLEGRRLGLEGRRMEKGSRLGLARRYETCGLARWRLERRISSLRFI